MKKGKFKSILGWTAVAATAAIGLKMHSKIKFLEGNLRNKEKECARKDWLIIKLAKKEGYNLSKR